MFLDGKFLTRRRTCSPSPTVALSSYLYDLPPLSLFTLKGVSSSGSGRLGQEEFFIIIIIFLFETETRVAPSGLELDLYRG